MTDASSTAPAKDTGPLIKEWRSSAKRSEQIAAGLAAQIISGQLHRWAELPTLAVLAREHDVSQRTVSVVKNLLAAHGFLTLSGRRYYVA